ncbi:M12 family metallopeptidase [Tenacibaculum tangerinum]|uniref:M12 family metallopeptidase n=1 Tax=Tenacibaculum tangerinum TaxID=3038772 RepID=A0ABY8KZ17_9FLAO|nr:M12 family metallopeptidase [Tenacibaculum tangerinum]WGH74472.1 M12 family metallopeptidase [Tenacibaculum tangerinum]
MKKINKLCLSASILFLVSSCNVESDFETNPTSNADLSKHEIAFPDAKGVVKTGFLNGQEISYEVINGYNVYQGDIILTDSQIKSSPDNYAAKTVALNNRRWSNNTVYYTVNRKLSNTRRVYDAIAHWEAYTNITFIEFNPKKGKRSNNPTNYIEFVPGFGCSSNVGMIGGKQTITLASGCSTGNAIHEIAHAVGVFHEHSRADRDNHIVIHYENISSGVESNFERAVDRGYNASDYTSELDFGSVMMYPSNAFSSNGLPTITKLDGSTFSSQRNGLSPSDIQGINLMYPASN